MCLCAFYKLYQDLTMNLPPRYGSAFYMRHLAGFLPRRQAGFTFRTCLCRQAGFAWTPLPGATDFSILQLIPHD